ncbi:MAG: YeeE/YedE thiosulfate transporter family protein [Bacillota bacterium]|nr:YeeE/YedE thiosulfate transporter family protein [Bacillota bacterium]
MEQKKNRPKRRTPTKALLAIAICSAIYFLYFQKTFGITHGFNISSYFLDKTSVDVARAKINYWSNLGIIIGAFLGAGLKGSLGKWKKFGNVRKNQLILALAGGILMGYGAKIANGCVIGIVLNGIPAGHIGGWLFALFLIPGVALGIVILNLINKLKDRLLDTKATSKSNAHQEG